MTDDATAPIEPPLPSPSLSPSPSPAAGEPPPRRLLPFLGEMLLHATIVLLIVTLARTFVVEAYVIQGISMEPTFHDAERLLITKFAPRFSSLSRGDIVIFSHPDEPGRRVIKRVIGLPGDRIRMDSGRVFVNDVELEEPYLEGGFRDGFNMHTLVIEEGRYFVLGDNRFRSNDSRGIGCIAGELIVGKALILFYPKFRLF